MDEVLREMADDAKIPYNGATHQPEIEPTVERNITGDYMFTWETPNGEFVRLKCADVGFVRGEMHTRLTVQYKGHRGAKPRTLLARKRWIPESTSSDRSIFTELNRWKDVNANWPAHLTYVSTYFEDNYETGDAAIWLDEVELTSTEIEYLASPVLQLGQHAALGARKGSSKSLTALAICLSLATGKEIIPGITPVGPPVRSLYLDYETNAKIHRRRLHMIARAKGVDIPPQMIRYKRMSTPLSHSKTELWQMIAAHEIKLGITDSIGRASGGETVGESFVQEYYNAVGSFGITWLSIGHPAKNGEDALAGNIQWINQARSVWKMESQREHGSNSLVVGLQHEWVNEGELHPALNYHVSFTDNGVSWATANDDDIKQLKGTDLHTAIRIYLAEHPNSTAKTIADALDKGENRIGNVLRDYAGRTWKSDGARPAKWVLLHGVYTRGGEQGGVKPLKGFTYLPHAEGHVEDRGGNQQRHYWQESDDESFG